MTHEELQEAWRRTRHKEIPLDYIVWDPFYKPAEDQLYWDLRTIDEVKVWCEEMEALYGEDT